MNATIGCLERLSRRIRGNIITNYYVVVWRYVESMCLVVPSEAFCMEFRGSRYEALSAFFLFMCYLFYNYNVTIHTVENLWKKTISKSDDSDVVRLCTP